MLVGNWAADRGGAIDAATANPRVTSCVIAANAGTHGGGLQADGGAQPLVFMCTFCFNSSSGGAAGISATGGSLVAVSHSIITRSSAGASVSCDETSSLSVFCTDIDSNAGGDWVGCIADQAEINGNFSADPLFCDLMHEDFHIQRDSPCANAAGCGLVGALPVGCGGTLVVDPDGSGDYTTIQGAVDAAVSGDTVELTDDIYTGPQNRDIRLQGKSIRLRSHSGNPQACVIDCQGTAEDPHRGFVFDSDEGRECVLEGLTVRNGYQIGGGGALISGAQPTIRNCAFTGNTAGGGGALQMIEGADPLVQNCRFEGNHASTYAGACDLEVCNATFRGCEFIENSCAATAGALLLYQAGATLDSCTFAGNTAQNGGAVAWYYPTRSSSVSHCTFHGNGAVNGGSLVTAYGAAPELENCILAFGTQGAAVHCVEEAGATFSCSDIYGNAGGDWVGCIAGQSGTNGNFSADPLLCDAAAGDFGLLETSPCAPENSPAGCGLIGAHGVGCKSSEVGGELVVIPTRLFLGPGAPNPLTGGTTISYGIPDGARTTRVVVRIYDVGGRRVATLVDADQAPGVYRVGWPGRDDGGRPVASGMYFCELRWNGESQSRRLVKLE